MNLEGKIREILNKVAINGTKGTSDNINQRVVIQGTTDIINLFKESLPEKKNEKVNGIVYAVNASFNSCLEEILNKLEGK